ncbi:MAG: hypothetical protein AAGD11_10540 [Planctomycetota bacterium]
MPSQSQLSQVHSPQSQSSQSQSPHLQLSQSHVSHSQDEQSQLSHSHVPQHSPSPQSHVSQLQSSPLQHVFVSFDTVVAVASALQLHSPHSQSAQDSLSHSQTSQVQSAVHPAVDSLLADKDWKP